MSNSSISLALSGSGGAGVVITGQLLLQAAGRSGLFGLMHRSAGPQIRGGESLAMLRFSDRVVECQDDHFRLLFALDWKNFSRFMAEVPLGAGSMVFADDKAGDPPPELIDLDVPVVALPLSEHAAAISGGRPNMVLLGYIGRLLGLPVDVVTGVASARLEDKGEKVRDAAIACVEIGYSLEHRGIAIDAPPRAGKSETHWLISGNEAAGFGALRAGVRFVAAYPITPASDVLEWMAPRLEQVGGQLVQAEDELASINMTIGASWGGVPSLTATSGPGLALMTEALGLAVASETPVTVLDVMRGGPSTGIPTKSEQSDLNIALYGLHGDAPHLVTAPLSITDCASTMAWTVGLSEALQVPAIVLSDQSLGQSQAVIPVPVFAEGMMRKHAGSSTRDYQRYRHTPDNVSPMAVPGDPGNMYTADGLEHNESGAPSTAHGDHLAGLDKRRDKLENFAFGNWWAECDGVGETLLLTWGSLSGTVREAASRLRESGVAVRTLCLRLLSPLPLADLREALQGVSRVVVIEQNHGAQLLKHLRAHQCLDGDVESFARPGPLPIRPGEIVELLQGAKIQ